MYFENFKGFSQTDLFPLESTERGECCLGQAGSPHHPISSLLPLAAHLHWGRKDDRSLHPLPRAGSLCGHAGHQGVRSVMASAPPASGWRSANRWAAGEQQRGAGGSVGCERDLSPGCIMSKDPDLASQIWK